MNVRCPVCEESKPLDRMVTPFFDDDGVEKVGHLACLVGKVLNNRPVPICVDCFATHILVGNIIDRVRTEAGQAFRDGINYAWEMPT